MLFEVGKVRGSGGGGEDVVGLSGIVSGAVETAFAVGGRSSMTVDCLLRVSSSSSAISISLLLRSELVEDDIEPEAVCSEHAAERVESRSSLESLMENSVSKGENRSVTALKCTVTRAKCFVRLIP